LIFPSFSRSKSLSIAGVLPADWKLAEVTAVYKKGPKTDRSNYRPAMRSVTLNLANFSEVAK